MRQERKIWLEPWVWLAAAAFVGVVVGLVGRAVFAVPYEVELAEVRIASDSMRRFAEATLGRPAGDEGVREIVRDLPPELRDQLAASCGGPAQASFGLDGCDSSRVLDAVMSFQDRLEEERAPYTWMLWGALATAVVAALQFVLFIQRMRTRRRMDEAIRSPTE